MQPSFRAFVLGPVRSVLYDVGRNQPRLVNFSRSSYSREHPLPASGDLRFYRMKEAADGLPPQRVEVAAIRVGARAADEPVIIVLVPNPAYTGEDAGGQTGAAGAPTAPAQPEFFSSVLDGSLSAHPEGTIRVINYARRNVALRLGDEQLLLSPDNPEGLIRYPQGDRAIMQIGAVLRGEWTPVYSSQQMFAPQTRLTLFIADQSNPSGLPEAEGITVQKIVEFF